MSTQIESNQLFLTIDKFYQQYNAQQGQLWAIRDENSAYIAYSNGYAELFGLKNKQDKSINSLTVDMQTKESILVKDHQVLKSAKTQTVAEAFIVNDELYIAEISRYPLGSKKDKVNAIGIVIAPLPKTKQIKRLNNKQRGKLSNRDLLIGLLLIHRWKGYQIAEHLSISQTRLTQIVGRICRSYFMVAGGGAVYRKLLIESGIYKQIPLTLLNQYSSETQKRWERALKVAITLHRS